MNSVHQYLKLIPIKNDNHKDRCAEPKGETSAPIGFEPLLNQNWYSGDGQTDGWTDVIVFQNIIFPVITIKT